MAQGFAKASKRLSAFVKADEAFASPQLRRWEIVLGSNSAMVVQAATKYLTMTSCTTSGLVVKAVYVNCGVAPAVSGGTATLSVEEVDVDGSTAHSIVDAATLLSGYTAFIPVKQTLAATNPAAITVGQTIRVTVTTSNNSVGTADQGLSVTLLVEHIEDTAITDTLVPN